MFGESGRTSNVPINVFIHSHYSCAKHILGTSKFVGIGECWRICVLKISSCHYSSIYVRMSYVWFTFSSRQDETRWEWVWRVHSSRLPHSRPVLVSSQSSRRHISKSVQSQRKWEYLKCFTSLSTILARDCECLHFYILRLVHILPKVSSPKIDVREASGK